MADKQSVVVTGISTGIGWGITKVLIANGFTVFGSVRRQSDADRLQREFGDAFTPLIMDVTDRQTVERAAVPKRIVDKLINGIYDFRRN
jgi:NADP-dependent 3-hydroxy acid dehydrogenase YdfG